MSLRVWLPLNGNLENKGLDGNIIVTNNNATVNNNGKIGKCYYFNGSAQYLQLSETLGDIYSGDFSWAVWLKPEDDTRGIIISEYASTGGFNVAFELLANRVIRVYWNGAPDISTGVSIEKDKWSHVTITKKDDTIKVYVNGELKTTRTQTLSDRSSTSKIRIGDDYRGGTSVSYMGYMNDVRIYDHALSLKQVQQIAKGLILHYKLDNNGMGGENLLLNSYGTIVDKTNNASGSRTEYFAWNVGSSYININETTQVTISFDLYMHVNDFSVYSGALSIYNTNNKGPVQLNTVSYCFKDEYEIGDTIDKRISFTTTLVPRSDATKTDNFIEFYTGYGSNNFYKISNVKLQLGNKATSWCPAKSELIDNNIIYDSSGYQNDGTIIGNIQSISDSPKYAASAYINSGDVDYIISQDVIGNPEDAITMNIWFKSLNVTPGSNYHELFNFATSPDYFEFAIYKTGYFRQGMRINGTRYVINGGSNLLDGNWHMLTATYDGTYIKRYIDGKVILNMTQNVSGTLNGANGKFLLGHYGSNTSYYTKEAYLSDARIYATALSAEDIKELYQTSALIDRNQSLYVRELVEI